ncbi:hypothetical protein NL390_30735, partial [Klebsiella pneumoniae]|nr:hypothetical protein [Klebsiella pneumoniae]
TPRVYYEHNELIEPKQGHVYGTLGNGLNPDRIVHRELETEKQPRAAKKRAKTKKAAGQENL